MQEVPTPGMDNMLKDIHSKLVSFPILFRNTIGRECLWSTPTFYRKLKDDQALSNAEKEKILSVFDEIMSELWDYFKKYRKNQS